MPDLANIAILGVTRPTEKKRVLANISSMAGAPAQCGDLLSLCRYNDGRRCALVAKFVAATESKRHALQGGGGEPDAERGEIWSDS
jgi:hypothetical protein